MSLTEKELLDQLTGPMNADPALHADSPLFSTGELDSVAMLELITFVEARCGIRVAQEDVTLANFDTVSAILRFAASQA